MKSISSMVSERPLVGWLLFGLTMVVVFLVGLLASSVTERRAEALIAFRPKVKVDDWEPRNEVWGKNFPREFQSYYATADTNFMSKYNGSAMIDMLEVDPRLVVLWAGYGFSKDYNQGRGHYYAVEDVRNTLRTGAPVDEESGPMVATCWTCKSPDVPRLMNEHGVAEFYKGTWARWGHEVHNPIGCADCHDPETMNLRISRPGLIEAFERRGQDVAKASHQEMRSLVCAQCHVEYYFNTKLPGKEGIPYLVFPWDEGMAVEDMERYYDAMEFSDWTHALSRAPMLKAQHPGYEIYLTGIHAQRGVSCADCHMPYHSEGGVKFTNHKIQSPLNNVASSCQVCHREEAGTLMLNVFERQDKVIENRDALEELIVRMHVEAKTCWELGATEEQMMDILTDIRHAQWRWDFAAASHGGSFHSPVETSRIIGSGLVIAQEGRVKLARLLSALGHTGEVPYPDIETKAKAQAFIGLDMEKLRSEKEAFKKTVVVDWIKKAADREAQWPVKSYYDDVVGP